MRELDAREAERLVNAYSDLILRLSYTWLKSTQDGEDICQTVLMKLLTEDRTFDSPEHERAWVVRTAINACKDQLRAFRRRAVPLEAVPEAPAIYLFYYEGYSIGEIAALTRRSEAAVSAHLSRGRKKLRELLGGRKYEPN